MPCQIEQGQHRPCRAIFFERLVRLVQALCEHDTPTSSHPIGCRVPLCLNPSFREWPRAWASPHEFRESRKGKWGVAVTWEAGDRMTEQEEHGWTKASILSHRFRRRQRKHDCLSGQHRALGGGPVWRLRVGCHIDRSPLQDQRPEQCWLAAPRIEGVPTEEFSHDWRLHYMLNISFRAKMGLDDFGTWRFGRTSNADEWRSNSFPIVPDRDPAL